MSDTTVQESPSCERCETVVEVCAFCEREGCPRTICYRCLRIDLRSALPQPHLHGG